MDRPEPIDPKMHWNRTADAVQRNSGTMEMSRQGTQGRWSTLSGHFSVGMERNKHLIRISKSPLLQRAADCNPLSSQDLQASDWFPDVTRAKISSCLAALIERSGGIRPTDVPGPAVDRLFVPLRILSARPQIPDNHANLKTREDICVTIIALDFIRAGVRQRRWRGVHETVPPVPPMPDLPVLQRCPS